MNIRKIGLKKKMLIQIIFTIFIAIVLVVIANYFISLREYQKQLYEKYYDTSLTYSMEMENYLNLQIQHLETFANTVEFQKDFTRDLYLPEVAKHAKMKEGTLYFVEIPRPDEHFSFISDGTIMPPDFDVTQRPWYKEAMAKDKLYISNPYVDSITGDMVVTISKRMKLFDGTYGVTGADIKISFLTNLVKEASEKGLYAFIVDRDKNIIAHTNDLYMPTKEKTYSINELENKDKIDELLKNGKLEKPVKSSEGDARFFFSYKVGNTGWSLVSSVDVDTINKPIIQSAFYIGLIMIVILIISIISTIRITNGIVDPLKKIGAISNNFADGNFKVDTKSIDI